MPWSIEQAPAEMVAAFLRGLYDADGCVVDRREEPLRRPGLDVAGAAAGRADAAQHVRHHEPDLPDQGRVETEGSFTYTNKIG